eukprot:gene5890-239_t
MPELLPVTLHWSDANWPKQSAQVLRLDSPNGTWQVDLDTGAQGY